MDTPICDFVRSYRQKESVRLHMPGHKGKTLLGFEDYDITEINGADSLYEANGIIMRSEKNAGKLFGAETFFSTEGSSLSIRAMIYLACLYSYSKGEKPLILAGRNAHKVFTSSAALLDFDVEWVFSKNSSSYISCPITPEETDEKLSTLKKKPVAVYITSPDYLGCVSDIKGIADVCHKYGVLLLVDNAHGAYLKFLPESRHPIDLGADACCDSAHKTLPVLTGGAYLHISDSAPDIFKSRAKDALALFGSTSPSYLILQSLDAANNYIFNGYRQELAEFVADVSDLKNKIVGYGYSLIGSEELKITVDTKAYGYYGSEFASLLEEKGLVCEFADPDFVVLMLTPQLRDKLKLIEEAFAGIEKKPPIKERAPSIAEPQRAMSIKEAYFLESEVVDAENSCGRILATSNVGCPPAIPIVVSGEIISGQAVNCFKYYGIEKCLVISK